MAYRLTQELWAVLSLALSGPALFPHSLCSPLGAMGAGSAQPATAVPTSQVGQPRGPDYKAGSLHQSGGFTQPSPRGPVLPVASALQPRLALTLLGIRGRASSGGPAGGGASPTGGPLGESWPPGRRVCRDPSLCAWHWSEVFMRIISFGSQQSQEIRVVFVSVLQIRKLRLGKARSRQS